MSSNELQSNVLRDLGSYGNIITEAQLLSRRDKVYNHRTGSFQTTCVNVPFVDAKAVKVVLRD